MIFFFFFFYFFFYFFFSTKVAGAKVRVGGQMRRAPACFDTPVTTIPGLPYVMGVSSHWLGLRGPDCNVIAEEGGGPDARSSWAGSGPRAGGCHVVERAPFIPIIRFTFSLCFQCVI